MPVFTTRISRSRLGFAGLLFLFSCTFSALAGPTSPGRPNTPDNSLEFTENKNQWDKAVKFAANVPGGRMYLRNNGFTFSFLSLPDHHARHQKTGKHQPEKPKAHAYQVTFLNASAAVTTSGTKQTAGYSNYFIGTDKSKWASEVLSYRQVNYSELYPGIGMQLYQYNKNLKYDFIVKPGADPATIKMQYEGQDKLTLENGELQIRTSLNSVTEKKPYAYQIINGKEVKVPCNFRLEKNVVTFHFPKGYDKKQELIIDPELVFSSFTGSFADNWGFTATYDSLGNMYSGGIVFGAGFPTTPGAYDPTANNTSSLVDIGIIKYNPAVTGAQSRLYATYLGGSQNDLPHSMVVNSQDELLVMGTTGSANFPVTSNAYDNSFAGGPSATSPIGFPGSLDYLQGSDLYISRLTSDGTTLLSSTFLGGTSNDGFLNLNNPLVKNYGDQYRGDITVDGSDNVYIASSTNSANFPVPNGFQTSIGGGQNDAVVCKFSPDLSTLQWGTFLGSSGEEAAFSVQVDNTGIVYVTGGTNSNNFPGVAGGLQPAYSGNIDGFISKISSTGNTLLQSTYLGTTSYDQAYFIQLDASANVYVFGQTQGIYPVTPLSPSTPIYSNPNSRQFIHKLNNTLTGTIFSTIFGAPTGQINISPTAFLVDDCERIFVCGWGGQTNTGGSYVGGNTFNMPLSTINLPHQATTDGSDFYLAQFSQNATNLDYATYIGGVTPPGQSGDHVDGGTSRFDKRGFVYQAVCASCAGQSSNFPTTPGAWSGTNNSTNCNNAAFKFDFQVSAAIAGTSQRVCANEPAFQLTGATPAGGVWSGPGVSPTGLFTPSPALVGPQTLTYTVTTGNCVSTSTKTITVKPTPVVSFSGLDSAYCSNAPADSLTGFPAGGTFSGPGITGRTFNPAAAGNGTHTITYSYTAPDSCTVSVSETVNVTGIAQAVAGLDVNVCEDAAPIQLTGATPAGGVWSGNGVSPTGLFTPSAALTGPQTLTYTITNGNCSTSSQRIVTVNPNPVATINGLMPDYCATEPAVTLTGNPAGGTFAGPGISSNTFDPGVAGNGTHTITYTFTSPDNCTTSASQTVNVSGATNIEASAPIPVCAADKNLNGLIPLTIKFSNTTTGAGSFLWNFGDGTSSAQTAPEHTFTQAGTFNITLTSDPGTPCAITIPVATIATSDTKNPNIITPNNDNKNETFQPLLTCFPATLQVYNRWGSKVFEQKNYDQSWNGKDLADGIYYYLLTDSTGQKWKGWVEIIR